MSDFIPSYWHEPSAEQHALAKLIAPGDWLDCATSLGHEWTGTADGRPVQNFMGEYVLSQFDGTYTMPIQLCTVREVWRGEERIYPPVVEQMRLWAEAV